MRPGGRLLRADLHVHTRHSRLETLPILGARDCYSDPRTVYLQAKARGMDLVTFTDHNTIDGCLGLLEAVGDLPDFFISEEVSVRDPRTGCRLHVGVYGIDEDIHREIQRLRDDVRELLLYLRERRIPASLNHVGSSLVRADLPVGDLVDLAAAFPLLETRNGAQRVASNSLASSLADAVEKSGQAVGRTGGSDAHTSRRIGWAWTEAEAENRDAFLNALRDRRVAPQGESARLAPMVKDVYRIVSGYYRDLAFNRNLHFGPVERWKALACALVSLPLHLVALPAVGTAFRQIRVHDAARRFGVALEAAPGNSRRAVAGGSDFLVPAGPKQAGNPVASGVAWIPRPGSEEA